MTQSTVDGRDPAGTKPRHVWDYWRVIWDGRYILAVALGVTVVVALVGTLLLPDRYRATVFIEIKLTQTQILGTVSERTAGRAFIQQERAFKTEFVRIRTRDMLQAAIDDHSLLEHVPLLARTTDPVERLRRITRVELVPQTNVVKLSVAWRDPEMAATIANAIAETYVASDLAENVALYRDRAQRLEASAQETILSRRLQLQTELDVIESAGSLEAVLALSSMEENPALTRLRGEHETAVRELERTADSLGRNHPDVQAKRSDVRTVREQLDAEIGAVASRLREELDSLGGRLGPEEVRRADLDPQRRTADEAFVLQLLQRLREQQVYPYLAEPKAKIIDPALPPEEPFAPSLGLNLGLAFVVGLGFGLGLIFFRDYLDVSVRTIDDIERDLALNLLAVVPRSEGGRLSAVFREAFQTLRTGLHFASRARRDRVLLVTSAAPREGKSSVVTHLARSLAASGESVVVVDCDLRRPTTARLLGSTASRGLSNYLSEDGAGHWQELVVEAAPKLHLLATGPVPPNPLDLLGQERFADLLKELKASYDWVLLDSPPVSSVSDGVVLASLSEMVLVVVRHDETDKDVIARALARLGGVGACVVGAVLNDVDMSKAYNRDYYYGRFYYGHYYGEEAGEEAGAAKRGRKRPAAGA